MKRMMFFAFAWAALTVSGMNAQVRQVGLGEMIRSSGMIFSGTVTEVRGDHDANGDIVTWTTFRVESPIRGVLPGSVTIKQFGGRTETGTMFIAHMRYFNEGERVLVMLYPASELGFTSPIGMGQGAWKVSDEGMIAGITPQLLSDMGKLPAQYGLNPGSTGQVALADMIGLIRAATNGGK